MRRRAFHAAVLSLLLLAGFAWIGLDKTVSVELDGQPRAVRTFARNVGGVLDHIGVGVSDHDLLAPSREVPVKDGSRIVLRRGRPLTITIDGVARVVWVTALNVDEALEQLEVRQASLAFVSASRSREIPLDGLALEVRTPARVRVFVDGKERAVTTTVPTVRQAIQRAGIKLTQYDKVSVALSARPKHNMLVRITRVSGGQITETSPIAYDIRRVADSSMYKGDTRTVVSGIYGIRQRVYAVRFVDKKLAVKKQVSSKILREPRTKVLHYGTKPRPYNAGVDTSSVDHLNWWALAQCESGNNPRAIGGGGQYRGLYQFMLSTWRGVGGRGDPIDATRSEQTYRAKVLYMRRGSAPWGYCGSRLYS